jgi:hypothetical protein
LNKSPEQSIKLLSSIFEKLKDMKPGQYLLNHSADEKFSLMENVPEEDGTYDLHYDFRNAGSSDTLTIPYVPLQWKNSPNQIPYTFNPKSNQKQKKFQSKKKNNSNQKNNSFPPMKKEEQVFSTVDEPNDTSHMSNVIYPEVLRNDQDLEHIMKNFL